jgi:hypothetical protein
MSLRINVGRQNLKEAKQLILEFSEAQKKELMAIENQFTVSYEIELESRGSMFTGSGEGGNAEEEYERAKQEAQYQYREARESERLEDSWWQYDDAVNRGSHSGPHDAAKNVLEYLHNEGNLDGVSASVDLSSDTFLAEVCIFLIGCEIQFDVAKAFYKDLIKQLGIHGTNLLLQLARKYEDLGDKLRGPVNLAAAKALSTGKIKTQITDPLGIETYQIADYLVAGKIPSDLLDPGTQANIMAEGMKEFISRYYFDLKGVLKPEINLGYEAEEVNFAEPTLRELCSALNLSNGYEALFERGARYLNNSLADGDETLMDVCNLLDINARFAKNSPTKVKLVHSIHENVGLPLYNSVDDFVDEMMNNWERENSLDDFYDRYGYPVDDSDEQYLAEIYSDTVSQYLPKFYKRFGRELKFESDGSLDTQQGLEFSCETYLDGLQEAMDFLDLFFSDYDDQDFLYLSEKTGMHINIGHKSVGNGEEADFNLIKGFLYLSEDVDNASKRLGAGKVARARKGLPTSRINSRWAGAIAPTTKLGEVAQEAKARVLADYIADASHLSGKMRPFYKKGKGFDVAEIGNDFLDSLKTGEMSMIEKLFSDSLYGKAADLGSKSVGFNINYSRGKFGDDDIKYVEFRFPGHQIDVEAAKDLTLYYAFLVRHMVDKSYMREDYTKKLIALLGRSAEVMLPTGDQLNIVLKPGNLIFVETRRPAEGIDDLVEFTENRLGTKDYLLFANEPDPNIKDTNVFQIPLNKLSLSSRVDRTTVGPFIMAYCKLKGEPIFEWRDYGLRMPSVFSLGGWSSTPAIITKVSGEGATAKVEIELYSLSSDGEETPPEYTDDGYFLSYFLSTPDYSPVKVVRLTGTLTGADIISLLTSKSSLMSSMYPTKKGNVTANHFTKVSKIAKELKQFFDQNNGEIPLTPNAGDLQ